MYGAGDEMWEKRGELSSTAPRLSSATNSSLSFGTHTTTQLQITHFANPTLTKPCKSDVWHFSDWGRKAVAYHLPLHRSANCISARFRQRDKLLNLLQVLGMAAIVFVGPRL
jgi:hypothetical protein